MASFGILYPLWDFAAAEGRLLEQAAGEVGLDHVTVPVVTGAQTQFRLAAGGEAPHFHTEGGWHYRPSPKAYAAAVLRPSRARWLSGGDALAQLRSWAAQRGVELLLRIDVRAVRALVDQQRHLCQRNAWGQEVPFAGACACNPDLRELLRATLEDLRRYEPAGYELVDWAADTAVDRASARSLSWYPAARRLVDICFCASCRQVAEHAGVDGDAAARSVRVQIERLLAGSAAGTGAGEDEPVLASYVSARAVDCGQWLAHLAEGDPDRRRFVLRAPGEPLPGNCAPWVRLVRFPAGDCGPLDGPVWSARRGLLGELSAVALPVWRPTFAAAADLVRLVGEAVQAGVSLLDFEGISEAAPEAVTWLKQAVRFARRS